MSKYQCNAINLPSLEGLSWITGDWYGNMDGTLIEEVWSAPSADSMMCMFRMVQEGKVRFYEFVTIEKETGKVVLRIKHYYPGMKGWEAKDESIVFLLVQLEERKAVFSKQDSDEPLWLIYHRVDEDTLTARFESESDKPKPSEGEFRFKRRV